MTIGPVDAQIFGRIEIVKKETAAKHKPAGGLKIDASAHWCHLASTVNVSDKDNEIGRVRPFVPTLSFKPTGL